MKEDYAKQGLSHVDIRLHLLCSSLYISNKILGVSKVLLFNGDDGIGRTYNQMLAVEDGTQHVMLCRYSIESALEHLDVNMLFAFHHDALQIMIRYRQMQVLEINHHRTVCYGSAPRLLGYIDLTVNMCPGNLPYGLQFKDVCHVHVNTFLAQLADQTDRFDRVASHLHKVGQSTERLTQAKYLLHGFSHLLLNFRCRFYVFCSVIDVRGR